MDLSLDNILQLSSLDIYNYYLNDFNNFYNNMTVFSMGKDEFKQIILEEIQESKQFYNGETSYPSYILNRLIKRIQLEKELYEEQDLKKYVSELNKFEVL